MSENNPTADDTGVDDVRKTAPVEENLKSRSTWMRGLFMLLACILFWIAGFVGTFVVIIGFLWVLFSGETNKQLQQIGQAIATYMHQIVRYLTFNTDARPFPFGESWPSGDSDETV